VVIRCERCSTLYELDEALLSPAGSQVQCTRCQHIFTAFPPRAAGRTLVGVPAQGAREAPSDGPERPAVPPSGRRTPVPAPAVAGAAASAPRAETPRAVRSGPPPVYRPSAASAPPTTGRAPLLKRDTVGTFESRLRWSARLRWLAPLAAAVVLGLAVAAWLLFARRSDPEATRSRADAMSLLTLDDSASLEQAISRLDALLRRSPKQRGAASERALAYVLRAATLTEEGESLSARLAARKVQRESLTRDQPAGWEEMDRAAAAEVQKLEPEVRAREERARSLGAAAFQALKKLQGEQGDGPDVARGFAAYYALGGDRLAARKVIRGARERAPADPWLDLAEAWVDARDPERAARERALVQLGALSVAHPELLRARYLLARTEAALGRQREAIATLDALLAANARHEAGKRLRDELTAPAPPPPPAPASEAKPPSQSRRLVTHTVPAPAPVPKVTVLPPLTPVASERQNTRPAAGTTAPAQGAAASGDAASVPSASAPPAAGAPPGAATVEGPPPRPETRRGREPSPLPDGG
jgi:predicted Zn finger-like uncharacterized protein